MTMAIKTSIVFMLEAAAASCPLSWKASTAASPIIAGIESRKLNLKAWSRFSPSNMAVEIVAPLLERPGKMASPCAMPIITAVL